MLNFRNPLKRNVTLPAITPTQAQERELYRILMDTVHNWQDGIRDLILPAWDAPSPVTTDADGQQLQWLVDQIARKEQNTIIYQTERLGRWVTKQGTWHGQKTISGIKSATGTDITPFIMLSDVRDILQESIRINTSLISSLNADAKKRVEEAIYDAFARRLTKKELTRNLAKAMGITQRRARLIAGDQTHKLNIRLTQYRNEQLGIEAYKWTRTVSEHPRHHHLTRIGKVFRWDKPPSDGHPGYAIGCKCGAQSILEYDDDT